MRFLKFTFLLALLTCLLFAFMLFVLPEFSAIPAGLFIFSLFLFLIGVADYLAAPKYDLLTEIIEKRNYSYAIYFLGLCIVAGAALLRS